MKRLIALAALAVTIAACSGGTDTRAERCAKLKRELIAAQKDVGARITLTAPATIPDYEKDRLQAETDEMLMTQGCYR